MTMQLSKPVGAAVLFLTALVGASIAKCTQHRGGKLLVLAEAFASGCLLCAALVHLLADASKDLDAAGISPEAAEDGTPAEDESYPYAALLCGLGAFVAHFINGVTQPLFAKLQAQQRKCIEEASAKNVEIPSNIVQEDGSEGTIESHAVEPKEDPAVASGPVLLAALSVHSMLEGLCVGAAEGQTAWELFLAILFHKGIAAFTLGVTWLRCLKGWRSFILATLVFSSVTPIGILIGQSVEGSAVGSVMKAIAAGTFLYIGLTETAPGVRTPWLPGFWRTWQMLFCLMGYGAMAVLGLYV